MSRKTLLHVSDEWIGKGVVGVKIRLCPLGDQVQSDVYVKFQSKIISSIFGN